MTTQKPNILLIHCDSMDGRVMGCAGHPAAHTPNIDRLAARGTRFHNTYTPSPVCLPGRTAVWSGRHVHHSRAWHNGCGTDSDADTFLPRLEAGGYTVHRIGRDDRFHDEHSFANRFTAWIRESGVTLKRGRPPTPILEEDAGERVRNVDWKHTDQAIRFLDERSSTDPQPFFLSLGYINPHPGGGYRTSRFYSDQIQREAVTLPPDAPETHPAMKAMQMGKNMDRTFDAETIRDIRWHYLGMIAEIDNQVGKVLDTLERNGLADSTVVIFFSDHGDMQMEHGQWRKSCMYEASGRVPLILAGPGFQAGEVRQDLASIIDLYPTLLELGGCEADPRTEGVSLTLAPEQRPQVALSQYHDGMQPTGSFMLRKGPWKWIEYPGLPPQLFQLEEDPDELNNRASSEPEVARDMAAEMRRHLDVEAIDALAKADGRRCYSLWRALVGRQQFRKTLRELADEVSDEDIEKLESWRESHIAPRRLPGAPPSPF